MTSVLFVTDAWKPHVNGVARTLEHTIAVLNRQGIRTEVISPLDFRNLPCPTYPEVRLSLTTSRRVGQMIDAANCTYAHLATEGPLGYAAAHALRKRGKPFTTSYHTRFPEYVAARAPVPIALSHAVLRRFHNRGAGCMVATDSLHQELDARGYQNLMRWPRGVDTDLFRPDIGGDPFKGLPRPILLNVGRIAVEKNLDAFLSLSVPGTKVIVGDGPAKAQLEKKYPEAVFLGTKTGEALAQCFAAADVFVFPSRTDTFGMVLLEALAAGTPVAAYPVMGPRDVIEDGVTGALSEDLSDAIERAATLSAEACRAAAVGQSWSHCTDRFLAQISKAEGVGSAG